MALTQKLPADLQPYIQDPAAAIQRQLQLRGFPPPARSVPNTRTRTTHGLTLRDGRTGRLFGAIHTFSPKQTRAVEEEWEINRDSRGIPVDLIPQNLTSRTIGLSRYDLYTRVMEELFGTTELDILTEQRRPFRMRETWLDPTAIGFLGAGPRIYEYIDCWFTDIGRTLSASDDRIVKVEATLMFRDRKRFI